MKMKEERISFANLMDVFLFRVIVDRADTCYRALGVIHNLYKPVAGRFKDYIAIPKANGYQSLHTTVVGRNGAAMDVQILTRQMDTVAENGIAGAWLYQDDEAEHGSHARARRWVAGLLICSGGPAIPWSSSKASRSTFSRTRCTCSRQGQHP